MERTSLSMRRHYVETSQNSRLFAAFGVFSRDNCANADVLAGLLNEALSKRGNWLPDLLGTEDAMRVWQESTPREYLLRLYRFLNQCGYTVIGIDAAIEREAKQRRAD